jgi:hypothetical protein
MELYSVILFAHIVSGMGMAAAVAAISVYERRGRGAKTVGELRSTYETEERIATKIKLLALLLSTSGLYMAHARWSFASSWVIAAILVFVYLASTGPLVFGRRMRQAVAAAERAGAINAEVRAMLNDPVLAAMRRLRVAFLALLVFLMTTKPGLAVTLAAFVTALAAGVLSGVLVRREASEPVEAM